MRTDLLSRRSLFAAAALPVVTAPGLATLAGPAPATDPHAAHRERIHRAYAWRETAFPIENGARPGTVVRRACAAVARHLSDELAAVWSLPVPATLDGLGVLALAYAIGIEMSLYGSCVDTDDHRDAMICRALLALTREPLPATFAGFGDEPGCLEAEDARTRAAGSLPAWALAGQSGPD